MIILDLPLKKEWYNMIEANIKTEEYREIKPYWIKRICKKEYTERCECCKIVGNIGYCFDPKPYTHVRFRFGYTSRIMLREIETISYGYGKPQWGAPLGKMVFIIKFKKGGAS